MKNSFPGTIGHALERQKLFVPVAIVGAMGFAFLLLSGLPFLAQTAGCVMRGSGFVCLGLVGAFMFGYAWWHRLPIRTEGGLSPARPFFYHLGVAFFLGFGLLLVFGGVSTIKSGLGG